MTAGPSRGGLDSAWAAHLGCSTHSHDGRHTIGAGPSATTSITSTLPDLLARARRRFAHVPRASRPRRRPARGLASRSSQRYSGRSGVPRARNPRSGFEVPRTNFRRHRPNESRPAQSPGPEGRPQSARSASDSSSTESSRRKYSVTTSSKARSTCVRGTQHSTPAAARPLTHRPLDVGRSSPSSSQLGDPGPAAPSPTRARADWSVVRGVRRRALLVAPARRPGATFAIASLGALGLGALAPRTAITESGGHGQADD